MKRTSSLPAFFRLLPASVAAALLVSASAPASTNAATLTDRYTFSNGVTDSVGSYNGTATPNGTSTEAPTYVTDAPTGAVGVSTAMALGANAATKTSGFSFSNAALTKSAGSIVFWAKPQQTSDSGADYLIYLPPTSGMNDGLSLYVSANTLNLRASVENSTSAPVATLTANTWAQLAVTWDSSTSTALVYVNGVLALTQNFTTAGSSITSSASPRIGNYNLGGTNLTDQYVGELYDFQVYSGALTSSEVSSLYANPGMTLGALAVPEPSTWALFFLGAAFLAWTARTSVRRAASNLVS